MFSGSESDVPFRREKERKLVVKPIEDGFGENEIERVRWHVTSYTLDKCITGIMACKNEGREKTIERLRLLVLVALNGVPWMMQSIFVVTYGKSFSKYLIWKAYSLFNTIDIVSIHASERKVEHNVCVSSHDRKIHNTTAAAALTAVPKCTCWNWML